MYSQSCSFLPNRKQTSFCSSIPDIGLFKNLPHKSHSQIRSFPINFGFGSSEKDSSKGRRISSETSNIGLMDFVWDSRDSEMKSTKNCLRNIPVQRETIAQYNTITSMPIVSSHLVGGFVGSKSQLGRRPTYKMWDIIREFVYLVGNSQTNITASKQGDKKCMKTRENNVKAGEQNNMANLKPGNFCKDNGNCPKQSYADVAKLKPPLKENALSKTKDELSGKKINDSCSPDSCNSVIKPLVSCLNKNYNRGRIASECSADSEDSFIVFEYCEGDDNIEDDSCSSDEESVLDCHGVNRESSSDTGSVPSENFVFNKTSESTKKVHFAEDKKLAQVHPMIAWDYAYRMARKGPWEMLARDTERFKNRITRTEAILAPVLDPHYREIVFRQRFTDSYS